MNQAQARVSGARAQVQAARSAVLSSKQGPEV